MKLEEQSMHKFHRSIFLPSVYLLKNKHDNSNEWLLFIYLFIFTQYVGFIWYQVHDPGPAWNPP